MKKVLVLLFGLAVFFQLSHGTELCDLSIPSNADRKNVVADVGSLSGRILGQLVLPEKLGIDHLDQVVDFDYSTDTLPFYVAQADGTVVHYQRLDSDTARAVVSFNNNGGFSNRRVWDYRSDRMREVP